MNKKIKKSINSIGISITIILLISIQIVYIYMYISEGDKEMMNLRYQQKTFLSSTIIVLGIVDIILIVGGIYYIISKFKKYK